MSTGQYARSADATASSVGERVVLYHRVSRTAIVLNPTGGWMWQRLSEPSTAAELTAALRQRFPALTVEDAERDVTSFLADSQQALHGFGWLMLLQFDVRAPAVDVIHWGWEPHTFGLRSSDPDILARAAVVLRPWLAASPEAAHSWTLTRAAEPNRWILRSEAGIETVISGDSQRAITHVEFHAVRALLEGPSQALTFHAALVARDNQGLLIIGPNEAGKSTLACELWRRGFSLLGDDVAIVESETAQARSAPRRVSLRAPSRRLFGEALWTRILATPSSEPTADGYVFHPDEVDGRPSPSAVRLAGCIFLARRGANHSEILAGPLSPGQVVLLLMPYSNLIRQIDTGTVVSRIAPLAATVPAYDMRRGPLPEMVAAVERLMDGML